MVNMNTIIGLVAFNFIFISNKYKAKKDVVRFADLFSRGVFGDVSWIFYFGG
jgi:hypothetical protein